MKKFLLLGIVAAVFGVISCSEPTDPDAAASGSPVNKVVKLTIFETIFASEESGEPASNVGL